MEFKYELEWETRPDLVIAKEGYEAYAQAIRAGLGSVLRGFKPRVVRWMKNNAPWQDRTGEARRTLWGEVQRGNEAISLVLGHGVYYGIYLETTRGGSPYPIVTPAVYHWGPKIWQRVERMMQAPAILRVPQAGVLEVRGILGI